MKIYEDKRNSRKTRFSIFFDKISITFIINKNLALISIKFNINNKKSFKISSILRKRVK